MEKMSVLAKLKQAYVYNRDGMKKFFDDPQTFSLVTKFGFAVFSGVCAVRNERNGHGWSFDDDDEDD